MPARWQLIFRYVPRYRRAVTVGLAALVLGNVCTVAGPVILRQGVQAIEGPARAGETVDAVRVAFWAGVALLLALVAGGLSFLKRQHLIGTSRRMETDLRRDLFAHMQRLPMRFFDAMRTGDLMSRATADLEAVRMAVGPAAMYLVDAILTFAGVLTVMLWTNSALTLWTIGPLAGIAAGLLFFAPRIHRASREVQDCLAAITARSQESFAGARVVRTFATEQFEQDAIDRLGRDYMDANVRLARIRGLTFGWTSAMGALGLAIILLVGGRQAIRGEFDVSGLLMFNLLQVRLIWPMMSFGWVLSLWQRGAAGLDRIHTVFEQSPERDRTEEQGADATGGAHQGALEMDGLTFAYNGVPVLHDISMKIPAGTTLGVVGPTGSGKSTLVALLARLYDPARGAIRIDGRDLLDVALGDLRGAIAFVPQEPFLFSATIEENVAHGRPHAQPAQIEAAVAAAHLTPDLAQLPRGLKTVVGERGVTLSGGQKQRTALARALVSEAPVLVLDDALSAVDTETEAAILANLRLARQGRTAIVVAHRISAVRDADQIVYLQDGRVVEEGTHDELLRQDGEYARLARMQALEAEIEDIQ